MRTLGALLSVVTVLWPCAAPALPFDEVPAGTLGAVAWGAVIWMLVSVLSAVLLSRWVRARALANERISADIRREDWEAALVNEERSVE
jgi:membrane protein implicated in regulation of membrane protease activity